MSDDKKPTSEPNKGDDKKPEAAPEPKKDAAPPDKGDDKANELAAIQAKLKAYEKRAEEAEQKLEEIDNEKLKKSGDLEGLLKRERDKSAKLSDKLKAVTAQNLRQTLKEKITKHAPDVHNLDILLKTPEMKETVEMDHDTLEVQGVEDALAKTRKAHPYLFKVQHRSVGPTVIPNPNGIKSGDNANALEFQQKILAAKPQERDKIRKQYGREV